MKNALALVIGLNDYQHLSKLDNAVNDAVAIGDSLERLGFIIKKGLDVPIRTIDTLIDEFSNELPGYDLGLFYFAGHGFQIDGENLLAGVEADTFTLASAKRDSILLDDVIKKMERSGVSAKVIILDACRKPIEGIIRGGVGNDFAPVFAPKGTLIAFSTSPGEAAKDGTGKNSHYTLAFVEHLKQENIEIELFFKRIRATVSSLTQGKQTSWEHTSLIGPLILNSGQLRHSKGLPYHDKVIADHDFKNNNSGSPIDLLIAELSGNFDKQNDAIDRLSSMSLAKWSDDQLFLVGRGLINAGENNSFSGIRVLEDLRNWLTQRAGDRAKHILNGMLYDIYFNGYGLFRKNKLKRSYFKEILDLQNDIRFRDSFAMISKQLDSFRDRLLYIPAPNAFNLPVDLTLENKRDESGRLKVAAINVHGKNITTPKIDLDYPVRVIHKRDLLTSLSNELSVPVNRITLNPSLSDDEILSLPYSFYEDRFTTDFFKEKQSLQKGDIKF